jgi:hypothetical protein
LPEHLAPLEKATPPACKTKTGQMPSLFERFDQVEDWRKPIGKRHKLSTAMAIVTLACLAGVGQGYRAMSRLAKRLTKLPRHTLRCWIHPDTGRSQVPSEAVFQRVLQAMPRSQIRAMASQWQNDLLGAVPATDAVEIGGKAVRGGNVLLVNAIAQPSREPAGDTRCPFAVARPTRLNSATSRWTRWLMANKRTGRTYDSGWAASVSDIRNWCP